MMEIIYAICRQWYEFENIELKKIFPAKGNRIVCHVHADDREYVLKAHPAETEEMLIQSAVTSLGYLYTHGIRVPAVLKSYDGKLYIKTSEYYIYIMDYIAGRQCHADKQDEFALGKALTQLHRITDFEKYADLPMENHYELLRSRFSQYSFKEKYDTLIEMLPDFREGRQTFIHSDIGPHNAIMDQQGEVVFIDLDGTGKGSPYVDLGYPLITQFVQYDQFGQLYFDEENARAFYDGYRSVVPISPQEAELIFQGALYMQILYMPDYGEEHVWGMWRKVEYAIKNKELLLDAVLLEGC